MSSKNKRLQLIIDLMEPDSIIADIGTDHAYLPIAALRQKKAKFAYAIDVNKQPLLQANKNIVKANLEEKIQTILSDGLDYLFDYQLPLDYVVISGLGSATIVKILEGDYQFVKNYLICSNTDPIAIRRFIKKRKWFVRTEMFFLDNERKYWLLEVSKLVGKKIRSAKDLFLGTNEVQFNDATYQNYLKSSLETNTMILEKSKDKKKNHELKKWNKQILKVI